MKKYLKFEYLYIAIIIVWVPLSRFILKADGAARSITVLTLFLITYLSLKKDFLKIAMSKPLIIWGLWVLYAFFNTLYKGLDGELPVYSFLTLLIVPYLLMVLISFLSLKNYYELINVLIFSFYLSLIIILLFNKNSFEDDRYGGEMNSNTVGLMSVVLLMFIYLKYFFKRISLNLFLIIGSIPVILIILTGSKTAFGGLILLYFSHLVVNRSKSTVKNIVKSLAAIILLLIPLNYLVNNTQLGERILKTTEAGEELGLDTGNEFLNKFGDRGLYYYFGWKVFEDNPVTGIGLNNYKSYMDEEYSLHTEYMIQLAELGIIGFILFLSFYFSIIKNLLGLRKIKTKRKSIEINLALIIILLLMITATRMFVIWYLYTVVGIVVGFVTKEEYKNKRMKLVVKEIAKQNNTNSVVLKINQ